MKKMVLAVLIVGLLVALGGMPSTALAIPTLQIYIEGAGYNTDTDTWVLNSGPIKLWVLGDVGSYGSITDVKLSLAYFTTDGTNPGGSASLTSATATSGQLPAPGDPSTPSAPVGPTAGVGATPTLGDGSSLPQHGIFNDLTCGDANGCIVKWEEFALGDFTLTDSPIGDYNAAVPGSFPSMGQINAYDVTIPDGWLRVHFDAYDHIVANGPHADFRYVNAPFSHDAGARPPVVPEPASLLLLGSGLVGIAVWGRRKAS